MKVTSEASQLQHRFERGLAVVDAGGKMKVTSEASQLQHRFERGLAVVDAGGAF